MNVVALRIIPSAVLPVMIDRLPPFSGHWPLDRVDQWFGWFFELLDAAQRPPIRQAVAADFGIDAIAMEARQGGNEVPSSDDSAGPQDIAHD